MLMNNRLYTCIICIVFMACGAEEKEVTESDLTGNWLVVSSSPQSERYEEAKLYAAMKDSLVGPRGLKLISIQPQGIFRQIDSSYASPGSWLFNNKNHQFFINNAGPGFHSFSGTVLGCRDDTMSIEEKLKLPTGPLSVIWRFKRIPADSPANHLFAAAGNQWRIKPTAPEADAVLKKKISDMFHYYAVYFALVSREADYFSPKRVLLPIKYYQHGVGMREYEMAANFRALFYNEDDARKAYLMVANAMQTDNHFPSGKDFVDEYARYFTQLEKAVTRYP
jgi:hypothetical protein